MCYYRTNELTLGKGRIEQRLQPLLSFCGAWRAPVGWVEWRGRPGRRYSRREWCWCLWFAPFWGGGMWRAARAAAFCPAFQPGVLFLCILRKQGSPLVGKPRASGKAKTGIAGGVNPRTTPVRFPQEIVAGEGAVSAFSRRLILVSGLLRCTGCMPGGAVCLPARPARFALPSATCLHVSPAAAAAGSGVLPGARFPGIYRAPLV